MVFGQYKNKSLWKVPTIHRNLCVCVCVCAFYVVSEDTNLYNDMDMTQVLEGEGDL